MASVVADTHALIWFVSEPDRLSSAARQALRDAVSGGGIVVSSITLVEMCYLVEKQRIVQQILDGLGAELRASGTSFRLAPVDAAVAQAVRQVPRADVPDMPDRIIAATALHLQLPLVSRDRKIRASAVQTIW